MEELVAEWFEYRGYIVKRNERVERLPAGGSTKNHKTIGGGEIQLVEDFILEILKELKSTSMLSRSVPEKYPVLRVLQMITQHRKKVVEELKER